MVVCLRLLHHYADPEHALNLIGLHELRGCGVGHQLALAHDQHAVGVAAHHVEVVHDGKHGGALAGELPGVVHHHLLLRQVKRRSGFIQQQQSVCLLTPYLGQHARKLHALPLAARQGCEAPVGKGPQCQRSQCGIDGATGDGQRLAPVGQPPQGHHLAHREVEIQVRLLRHDRHAARQGRTVPRCQVGAQHVHHASGWPLAGQGFEHRGLSRAVGANQGHKFARVHRHLRHAGQHARTSAHLQAVQLQGVPSVSHLAAPRCASTRGNRPGSWGDETGNHCVAATCCRSVCGHEPWIESSIFGLQGILESSLHNKNYLFSVLHYLFIFRLVLKFFTSPPMQENRPIDMQALRVFIATAQDCNMSKASERLGVSQSAVSQTLRVLEESIGAPLLNRSARPLTLTPAGVALFNRGRILLEEALNLRGAVIEASKGIKPNLRLGLVDSFAAACGTPLVNRLLSIAAELSVRTGLTPNLGEALARRELDLVITTRALDLEGMVNHLLMTERFVVIAPKNSSPECRTLADLKELSKVLHIVRFNQHSHLGEQVERVLRYAGLNPVRRLQVDNAGTLTSMVAGGIGWAITTPLCLLQGSQSASALRINFISELNAERKVFLHARQGEYGSLAKTCFEAIGEILQGETAAKLQSIHPKLPSHLQTHPWNENA